MKKKLLAFIIGFAVATIAGTMLVACGETQTTSGAKSQEEVYSLYVEYAEESGVTPLTYDEWLLTIKGDDGVSVTNVTVTTEVDTESGITYIVFTFTMSEGDPIIQRIPKPTTGGSTEPEPEPEPTGTLSLGTSNTILWFLDDTVEENLAGIMATYQPDEGEQKTFNVTPNMLSATPELETTEIVVNYAGLSKTLNIKTVSLTKANYLSGIQAGEELTAQYSGEKSKTLSIGSSFFSDVYLDVSVGDENFFVKLTDSMLVLASDGTTPFSSAQTAAKANYMLKIPGITCDSLFAITVFKEIQYIGWEDTSLIRAQESGVFPELNIVVNYDGGISETLLLTPEMILNYDSVDFSVIGGYELKLEIHGTKYNGLLAAIIYDPQINNIMGTYIDNANKTINIGDDFSVKDWLDSQTLNISLYEAVDDKTSYQVPVTDCEYDISDVNVSVAGNHIIAIKYNFKGQLTYAKAMLSVVPDCSEATVVQRYTCVGGARSMGQYLVTYNNGCAAFAYMSGDTLTPSLYCMYEIMNGGSEIKLMLFNSQCIFTINGTNVDNAVPAEGEESSAVYSSFVLSASVTLTLEVYQRYILVYNSYLPDTHMMTLLTSTINNNIVGVTGKWLQLNANGTITELPDLPND